MPSNSTRLADFKFPKPEGSSDEKLLADVHRHGWHIVAVPEDSQGPGFAFTIGLYLRTLQPEVLIMGVPPEPSGRVLNAIGEYLVGGGNIFTDFRYPKFVDGREVIFRPIAQRYYRDYLGTAIWFYRCWSPGRPAFPVVQCIWPDLKGVFPHEHGFQEKFRTLQIDLSA